MQWGGKVQGREEKRQKRWQIRDDLGRVRHCGQGAGDATYLDFLSSKIMQPGLDEEPIKKDWHHLSNSQLAELRFQTTKSKPRYLANGAENSLGYPNDGSNLNGTTLLYSICIFAFFFVSGHPEDWPAPNLNGHICICICVFVFFLYLATQKMGQRLTWNSDLRRPREGGGEGELWKCRALALHCKVYSALNYFYWMQCRQQYFDRV